MATIPLWFLAVLLLIPVALGVALVYYGPDASHRRLWRRWGLSRGRTTLAAGIGLLVLVGLGLAGEVPTDDPDRLEAFGYTALGLSVPLIGGLLALAGGVGFGQRWWHLRRAEQSGTDAAVHAGSIVSEATEAAPVTGRQAVCWVWTLEVYDPHGAEAAGQPASWVTMADGTGGAPVRPAQRTYGRARCR